MGRKFWREPLRFCYDYGKVTFTIPLSAFGQGDLHKQAIKFLEKVTYNNTFTEYQWLSFQNLKVFNI